MKTQIIIFILMLFSIGVFSQKVVEVRPITGTGGISSIDSTTTVSDLEEETNPDHSATYDTTNQKFKYTEVATGTGLSWPALIDSIYSIIDSLVNLQYIRADSIYTEKTGSWQ